MPYANNRGTRIHFEVEGGGPALVLQHGFTGNLKRWHTYGYVDALKADYQLILVDARGHGASDKPHDPAAYDLPLRVGDVLSVLDALELDRAHYWGYSMGGWIGFGMAKYAAQRVHALVIGGAQPFGQQWPASSRLDGSDPQAFLTALGMNEAAMLPEVRADFFANDFRALAAARGDRPSLEEILPTMSMPCCLYAGVADPLYPRVLQAAQRIPQATSFAMPNLDHGTAFREAGLALPHVTKFLHAVTEVPAR